MSYGLGKKDNEYARELLNIDAPKTVWMALAYSFAARIMEGEGVHASSAVEALVWSEWEILHANNIVPQKPRRG